MSTPAVKPSFEKVSLGTLPEEAPNVVSTQDAANNIGIATLAHRL